MFEQVIRKVSSIQHYKVMGSEWRFQWSGDRELLLVRIIWVERLSKKQKEIIESYAVMSDFDKK